MLGRHPIIFVKVDMKYFFARAALNTFCESWSEILFCEGGREKSESEAESNNHCCRQKLLAHKRNHPETSDDHHDDHHEIYYHHHCHDDDHHRNATHEELDKRL